MSTLLSIGILGLLTGCQDKEDDTSAVNIEDDQEEEQEEPGGQRIESQEKEEKVHDASEGWESVSRQDSLPKKKGDPKDPQKKSEKQRIKSCGF